MKGQIGFLLLISEGAVVRCEKHLLRTFPGFCICICICACVCICVCIVFVFAPDLLLLQIQFCFQTYQIPLNAQQAIVLHTFLSISAYAVDVLKCLPWKIKSPLQHWLHQTHEPIIIHWLKSISEVFECALHRVDGQDLKAII